MREEESLGTLWAFKLKMKVYVRYLVDSKYDYGMSDRCDETDEKSLEGRVCRALRCFYACDCDHAFRSDTLEVSSEEFESLRGTTAWLSD